MSFSYPMLWLVLLIVFAGVEGLTAGLISIWFCAGSLIALFASWFNAPLVVQIALFAIVSVLSMAVVRPLARKYFQPNLVKTNADRILDQEGLVIEAIDNRQAKGQVKVGGSVWTARSVGSEPIPQGTLVRVERIEGVKAMVRPIPSGSPEEDSNEENTSE